MRVTCYELLVYLFPCLLCHHTMNTFADKTNINDLHVAQVRFGGDVFLKPGSKRTAQQIAEEGEH